MPVKRLRIHGKVQGVSYRDWTVATARGLGLSGWVRNRADGTVEVLVQDDAAQIETLITRCHEGPPLAKVSRVDVLDDDGAKISAAEGFTRYPTA